MELNLLNLILYIFLTIRSLFSVTPCCTYILTAVKNTIIIIIFAVHSDGRYAFFHSNQVKTFESAIFINS